MPKKLALFPTGCYNRISIRFLSVMKGYVTMRRYLFGDFENIKSQKKYDVIIVGAGLAGLYAALNITDTYSVALITKGNLEIGSSWLAQGGIAAVTKDDDCFEDHIQNTLTAGAGHCDKGAVEVLVKEGPEDIKKMIELGVPFDRDENGEIIVTREGGHNRSRILHCGGDATGKLMTKRLGEVVEERENIDVFFDTYLVDVLTDKNGVCGVVINDGKENSIMFCRNVIVSTGAIGQLYRYTTNPHFSTGDGIAVCTRAGAVTKDMEFVQFHPTAFALGEEDGKMFLISEAVRGEGGILKNKFDEPFMCDKHPLRDLAPRDIVTRFILSELEKTGGDYLYLDVSCMSEEFFKKRFPTIYEKCKSQGINVPFDKIPVRPTQHYHMGGVKTDLHARTGVSGLYACGEVACTGVQGANRLASNSTLECLVFGRRAAEMVNCDFRPCKNYDFKLPESVKYTKECPSEKEIDDDILEMKNLMSQNVGPIRNTEKMQKTLCRLEEIREKYCDCTFSNQKQYWLWNAVTNSIIITQKAIERKESIGSHYLVK